MKRILLLAAVVFVGGCGIDKEVYEAKVAELNKTKAELDQSQKDAAEAKRRCDATQARLDAENMAMKQKLTALGQDISKLTSTSEEDKKRIADLQKRAGSGREARAAVPRHGRPNSSR